MKDNFEKFIEAVKAGKIENLSVDTFDAFFVRENDSSPWREVPVATSDESMILKDHIRRWLNGKGYRFNLGSDELFVVCGGDTRIFREGSELKWHIDAALWVIAREG